MNSIPDSTVKTIVLVHGGFVDGSGWEEVYKILKKDGYTVSIVQNPTLSLADDVAVTKRVLATHTGPVILVGHSYGGAVITEAGNDPKVAGLVYITAFALDNGESVSALIKDPRLALPCHRYCHRKAASCSSIRRSSLPHLLPTSTQKRPPSWLTPKSLGASKHSAARSVRRHGGTNRVGIWSPPRTK